jgi:cellulose synthase/poly-beta-1,6-N-acetylglucosamine synthase-like glycosyltransferase
MLIISIGLTALLSIFVAAQVLLAGYLLFLTGAALITRPGNLRPIVRSRRFAILVPAHNEEGVIERLLASLAKLDYPADCVDVCLVADNCDDATATIAQAHGVRVYERFDDSERAKGFALRWLLQQLEAEGRTYDAFVVVDADSILDVSFLRCMNARLERGAQAIQAYYSVLNPEHSSVAGLRSAALAAVHYVRPLGRSRFGLSAGLKGNGMCFTSAILQRFAWQWFTLAEDIEFQLALVAEGIRVEFAPETWVKADMPVTLNQAASQNERWERGRLQLVRQQVPRLLWAGLQRRSWLQVDAAIEQLIPPMSVPFAFAGLVIPAAVLLGAPWLVVGAALCLSVYVLHLVAALVLVRAPTGIYLALGMAPVYIVWKLGLYARSLLGERGTSWVRTARTPSGVTPG